jgi:hypothetical protein
MPNPANLMMTIVQPDDQARATALISEAVAREESAETWYLAAMVATDRRERLQLLQKALDIDPFHPQAVAAWESTLRSPQQTPSLSEVMPQPPEALARAVDLFTHSGWELKVEMTQMAQLEKRQGVDLLRGSLIVGLFSVIGMLAVMFWMTISRTERVNIQAQADGSLKVLSQRRSMVVSDVRELKTLAGDVHGGGMTYLHAAALGLVTLIFWLIVL